MSVNSIKEMTRKINSDLERLANRTLDELNKATTKASELAIQEFGAYQREEIARIFNSAVDQFYEAYSPRFYKRTHSLYDVLDMKIDNSGGVNYGNESLFRDLYDESQMTSTRSGGSIFDQVFVHGYHGGAPSIDSGKAEIWGKHPDPGTPYYRKPGFVKYPNSNRRKWHRYGKWGRKAIQTKAPIKMVYDELSIAEGGYILDKFKEISQKYNDEAVQGVIDKIPILMKQISG